MADWLNKTFHTFDRTIFSWMHALEQRAGGFFTGLTKFVSFFGKGGWAFIVLALIFLLFKRMRKAGLGMGFALAMGALVTNILLKNIVGRPRPFTENEEFFAWWQAAGSSFEDSASFPSGHTTAAFASMVALFIVDDKRVTWAGLLFAFLMAFSRVYLIVHYPTDVIVGFLVGTAAGIAGAALSKLVYRRLGGKPGELLRNTSVVSWIQSLCRRKPAATEEPTEETPLAEDTAEKETVEKEDCKQSPPSPNGDSSPY